MAYSLIELNSRDLDIFFQDGIKMVHLASAGGHLPESLLSTDSYNEDLLNTISIFNQEFEFEINPNLIEILGINQEDLESYIPSFVEMAKRGLFSYDKSNLGDYNDQKYHLVARPKSPLKINIQLNQSNLFEKVIKINRELPSEFISFNLSEYIP